MGGTVWHTVGGLRNAPKGQMMRQAISRVRARVPMLGGSFAVWGTLFSCCDCTFTYIRKKEDPWNAIMSGAATGGILAARAGLKAAGKSALVGGVILAAIEGLNLVVMRVIMPQFEKQQLEQGMEIDRLEPPLDPLRRRRRAEKFSSGAPAPRSWDQSVFTPPPSTGQEGAGGFDLDSILSVGGANSTTSSTSTSTTSSQWDTPGYSTTSPDNQEAEVSKPFWKFW